MKIFEQGFLTQLYIDAYTKVKRDKLENHSLTRIASALGELSKHHDLYDLLFTQPQQTLETYGNVTVNSKDLMAFVLLDHHLARGYFSKTPGSNACVDTTNSQGVPLALEGAKRLYDKSYMSWLPIGDDKEDLWKCDVFLPEALASLRLNDSSEIMQKDTYGLITLLKNNVSFTNNEIQEMRDATPNYLSAWHPPVIKNADIYNKCNKKVRALILGGWIWSEHLPYNPDMIYNIQDWDAAIKPASFEGLKPKTRTAPGLTGNEPKYEPKLGLFL